MREAGDMQIALPATILLLFATFTPASAATGAELFTQRCAMCHQAKGTGLPNQFPRLAGRAASIAQSPQGRHYLALLMLNGMVGTIKADGQSITGLMPSVAALPDGDVAAILNQALQLSPPAKGRKPAPITQTEIATARKDGSIGPSAVADVRGKLVAEGLIP